MIRYECLNKTGNITNCSIANILISILPFLKSCPFRYATSIWECKLKAQLEEIKPIKEV